MSVHRRMLRTGLHTEKRYADESVPRRGSRGAWHTSRPARRAAAAANPSTSTEALADHLRVARAGTRWAVRHPEPTQTVTVGLGSSHFGDFDLYNASTGSTQLIVDVYGCYNTTGP